MHRGFPGWDGRRSVQSRVLGLVGALGAALTAATAATALAACAIDDGGAALETYQEPGWMAGLRQETEQYTAAMLTCLSEFGVEGIVAIGGHVVTGGVTDEDGNLPPGAAEIRQAASEECNARVDFPLAWSAPGDADTYARILEVRECLIARGVDVPEPPSEAVWLDRAGRGDFWSPYETFNAPGSGLRFPDAELAELNEACPQYGPGVQVVVPESAFS